MSFSTLVRDYLEHLYQTYPSVASFDGVHRYDDQLEDFSAGAISRVRAAFVDFRGRLALLPADLDPADAIDRRIVAQHIDAKVHDLDEVRAWEKNPQLYVDTIAAGLVAQTLFPYAPPETRLRHVVAKLGQVPRLLESARRNVRHPPRVFVQVGIETAQGALHFMERDLPAAFEHVGDLKLRSAAERAIRTAADAMRKYIGELVDLEPRAKGSYVLGAETFARKLRLDEGVEVPLDHLLVIAERELALSQQRFHAAAAVVDPSRSALDVWHDIKAHHPAPGAVVGETQGQLDTLRRFLTERAVVSVPAADRVEVRPTPEFYRWTFASMWTPGPFESEPLPAFCYVTDVDPSWGDAEQQAHLRDLNYPTLWVISIHEVYPGHFLQFQVLPRVRSALRRSTMLAPASFIEGWAHYCEQMMFEEGFGADDPTLRLGELAEELIRLVRFIAAIKLHTAEYTVEQAARRFVTDAYLEEVSAMREARRGTFDPMYLAYSLGKLGLLKLRDDWRRAQGARFSLRRFHDALLANGNAPLWAHRELLMGRVAGPTVE